MEGPRAPRPDEFNDVVGFLNQSLRVGSQWSISDEYPTAITPATVGNSRIIKDETHILSHALVKPALVKTRRGLFKMGCIGSVVTDEKFRSQGLSQTVIRECLHILREQGCEIALLWTDLYEFYRKLGFELAGSEISLLCGKPLNKEPHNFRIIQDSKVDTQSLFRLYSQHSVGVIRSLDDFDKFLRIPNSRLYTAWNTQGGLEAYAVEGKGIDLQGYIHEWGGTIQGVVALCDHIREVRKAAVTLISPTHAFGLIRKMEELGASRIDGYLGMMKLLNSQSLFSKVIRNAMQEWGISNFKIGQNDGRYFYSIGDALFETEDESDIIKLLFGPKKPSQLHDHGAAVNQILDRFLPLEMWLWGWDSI